MSIGFIRFEFLAKTVVVLMFNIIFYVHAKAQLYNETYRPQFHATPEFGFMGDPNGPIKYEGIYHLFYWGHLTSQDLVHWTQRNTNALNGTPGGYGNWSGSVVVDKENTAGFNTAQDTAMIAIYTLHQNATKIQQQAISISLNHVSFNYYSQNPVLPYNGPDFRDPQVFWHKETGRWVMVITKPLDRSIEIYSSSNIKDWTFESIFSDRGAKREVWEVPDLFLLPVNDDVNNMKWVMTCGMGPNRMQYWVGDFDGSKFTLDPNDNLLSGKHVEGEIFNDFENGFGLWKTEGTAFGSAPANGSLPNQQRVDGFTGFGYLNSFHDGDDATGKIISTDFIINKRYINFQIGGGSQANVGFNIIVENQVIETILNSANSERMQWRGIDVSQHIGKNARIEIFDNATGGWGHILVDHIVFSDVQYDSRIENANWMDWGADFYAHKSFRNYDEDDNRTIGLAWMGNWAYAQTVPTTPWKGCQSIPRELKLVDQGKGYALTQKPIQELQTIRQNEFFQNNFKVNEGTTSVDLDLDWNVFEFKISYLIQNKNQNFGINFAEGNNQKIVVSYDALSSNLTIDRTNTPFNYAFNRIQKIPVYLSEDNILDLHIFVDQSSIEIFAEGYKYNMASLAFNEAAKNGISLFSEKGSVDVIKMEAWQLKSIWSGPSSVNEDPTKNATKIEISPNPIESTLRYDLGPEHLTSVYEVKIIDVNGKVILQVDMSQPTDSLDVSFLTTGTYFLQITSGEKVSTSSFLKK